MSQRPPTTYPMKRKRAVVASLILVAFLFAYLAPVFYTGNYVAVPQSPVPSWSKVYGSLTCILWLRLENQQNGSTFTHTAPASNPQRWDGLGVLYQGGNYYLRCNPYTVTVG